MSANKIIWEYPKGLLNWYGFEPSASVLYITNEATAVLELLQERCSNVLTKTCLEVMEETFLKEYGGAFDYIVAIEQVERLKAPVEVLAIWKRLMKSHGRLLLGMENRLGLRYFCGDRDPYTDRNFDGIEHYRGITGGKGSHINGRCYSYEEIQTMLNKAGLCHRKFYSVLPNLQFPQLIYREDYLPEEELAGRYVPMYHHLETVFLEEEYLYTDIIKNGMFHPMANAYLIECSLDQTFETVKHVTLSMDRGEENAVATMILENGTVKKTALYEVGKGKIKHLLDNTADLRSRGLNMLELKMEGDSCIMPYMACETLVSYLRRTAKEDENCFIEEMDKFRDLVLQSSEPADVQEDKAGMGVLLKKGYVDLMPLNCFYNHGTWCFFDQEFCQENYPANAIIYRAIRLLYTGELGSVLSPEFFYDRYHLTEQLSLWKQMAYNFISELRNLRKLRPFFERYHRDPLLIHTNRQRLNYSVPEYQRRFVDLYRHIEGKKIILFGSGNFTKHFLECSPKKHLVYGVVDNDMGKWGSKVEGITIYSPELLKEMSAENFRVIICVKNYVEIVHQLCQMDIDNYCIYDINMEYRDEASSPNEPLDSHQVTLPKKYHIGYIAGVFDLFHIGHLNMFKRAKELCDYLIVGVVTDEGVRRNKKHEPYVCFEERLELVRSCRYVDEVEKIPLNYDGVRDTYHRCHFDCKFSGSDYIENPDWQADKVYLEKQGADLVFFPYTESTSSTKLKSIIEKSLL